MTNLETIMANKGTPTLKAIATVFGLQPTRIYAVAKTPKEGEIYDAKAYNWEAIENFIERRLGQNDLPETLEEVIDKALVLDEEFRANDGRKHRGGAAAGRKIEVDGKIIPERRYAHHEFKDADGNEVMNLIALKKDGHVYKIVFQTRSHTVLVPVMDPEGNVNSDIVKVVSNFMMNHRGYNAIQNEDQVALRFAGDFVAEEEADDEE